MKYDKRIVKTWIEAINDLGHDLTEWEIGFMSDITEQFADRGTLSEKQEEIVERIYTNKVK